MIIPLQCHNWIATISPYTGKPKTMFTRLLSNDHVLTYDVTGMLVNVRTRFDGRVIHRTGQVSHVQAGRNDPGTVEIVIQKMIVIDVRHVPAWQIELEGYNSLFFYLRDWTRRNDPAHCWIEDQNRTREAHNPIWKRLDTQRAWIDQLMAQPPALYQGIAIMFKLKGVK